jgi:DNA-binding IclR family transcriptional regulator
MSLLEVHTEGATIPELCVYTGRHRDTVIEHLTALQEQGKVFFTPGDRTTKLWHLTTPEAETRAALTPAPIPHPHVPLRLHKPRGR